jgi:uncharacterized protein YuzE
MKSRYFQDTDTLYLELKAAEIAESKDLDENTVLDLDQSGNICGMTVEHARQRARMCLALMTVSGETDEHLRRNN